MTLEELKHLKGVCAKATPGPWKAYPEKQTSLSVVEIDGDEHYNFTDQDATFIATFNPQQVAELLALVEKLKAHCKHHKAFEDAATHEAETLRAEVEKLRRENDAAWRHPAARQILELRDWQRRALPLIKCWLALSYCDGYFLQDETEMKKVREGYEELIAEAGC